MSSSGVSATSTAWYFAEGGAGSLATDVLLANPTATAATVTVNYLHQNGATYTTTLTVPANARHTLATPGSVPAGGFGLEVLATHGVGIVAERSVFAGASHEIGGSGPGASQTGTRWFLPEGQIGAFWDTYIVLANPTTTAASVTVRFRNTNGTVVETPVTVPARGRAVVDPKAVSGMGHPYFSTDVIVLNGVGLVAERAMYFFAYPNWTASHISLGKRY